MVPMDLFVSLPGMLTKSMALSVPPVLEKNEDASLVLTTIHKKHYPVRSLMTALRIKGDDFSDKCKLICSGEDGGQREVKIDTSNSGMTTFYLKRVYTVSLLGLFTLPVNIEDRKSVIILPPSVKPANTLALQTGTHLRPKPGGGFSEEHDMRMYRKGDPIRSIHWKISAKFDSLVIREPLVPPPHGRLLLITPWRGAAERDIILGRMRWVAEYLLKWQMPFYIRISGESVVSEITQASDIIDFLHTALDKNADKKNKAGFIPSRYSWIFRVDAVGA